MNQVINKNNPINKTHMKRGTVEKLFWLALVLPSLIIITLFIIIPIIDSIFKSFTQFELVNIIKGTPATWNNFENYKVLLERGVLGNAVSNTLIFVLSVVILSFIVGMTLALILNTNIKSARFIRSIMMTPWVVPTVISALIWNWIFQPQYGLFRYFVNFLTSGRVSDFAILNHSETALIGVTIAALWKQIPLMTLLLVAGLQNVPDDILEAAKIDGASGAKRLFKITIPYMKSVIKVAVSMSIIANFKQFPLFWQMTGGGPNGSTTTLAVLSYKEAFIDHNFGSGAAVTTIWMIIMIIVVFFYNKIFKNEEMD